MLRYEGIDAFNTTCQFFGSPFSIRLDTIGLSMPGKKGGGKQGHQDVSNLCALCFAIWMKVFPERPTQKFVKVLVFGGHCKLVIIIQPVS